jgi:hypothetical protein
MGFLNAAYGTGFMPYLSATVIGFYGRTGNGVARGHFQFTSNSDLPWDDNNWHHILYMVDYNNGSDCEGALWFDGASQAITYISRDADLYAPVNASVNVYINGYNNIGTATELIASDMTEIAIWQASTVFTTTEIANLASSYTKRIPTQIRLANQIFYLPTDDQEAGSAANGDTVRDLSGNANNGTGDDGANNTGLTWSEEKVLSYPPQVI